MHACGFGRFHAVDASLSTFLAYGEARSAVLGFKYRF